MLRARTLPLVIALAIALALVSTSCSSSSGTSSPATGSDGGSMGNGDDGGAPGPDGGGTAPDTVTLTMGPFTVQPGTEVYKCQDFPNPFGGTDEDVRTYEVHMSSGSHHMFLFFNTGNTSGPVVDCPQGGLEFHPYPFTSQSPDSTLTFPDGVGSLVPGNYGFRINAHYINPGSQPIQATVTATLHRAAPGSVQQHAGVVFLNDLSIKIPPGVHSTSTTCKLPTDMNVILAGSHMHQRGTGFTAQASSGQMLFQTTEWADPPPRAFSPPMALAAGTDVTWGCTYDNETSGTLVFGESAATNVMCIFNMAYYPVANPASPTVSCMK